MIVIKRWVLIALAALVVVAVVLSITLTSCNGRKNKGESPSSSDNVSSYTESELKEIEDWWSSVEIEEGGDTSIQSN